jgi:ATP-dependent helicase HrpA
MLARTIPPLLMPGVRDTQEQLQHLVYPGFLTATPVAWLAQLPRFLKAAEVRLGKIFDAGAARDAANLQVIKPLWRRYLERRHAHRQAGVIDPELEKYRWMVEELRVSMFAQELKTSIPISPQRLEKQWELVRGQ